jgi:hypothetical protein
MACLLQFLLEVLFYATTECLVMSFIIPDLVRNEVQGAGDILRNLVDQVCSGSLVSNGSHFDASTYLFVST